MSQAKVRHRGCSRPLQRVVTDFGADVAFAQVEDKLVEHYGILLAPSTIRRVTEAHAQAIYATTPVNEAWPSEEGSETVALRLNRANRQWDNYWNQVRKAA